MLLRFHVDFNTMMQHEDERVIIGKEGLPQHDQELLKLLRPGIRVVLHDSELEVEAIAEYDAAYKGWLGKPDWSTCRDLPAP